MLASVLSSAYGRLRDERARAAHSAMAAEAAARFADMEHRTNVSLSGIGCASSFREENGGMENSVFPAALCTREGAVAPLGLHARAGRRGGEAVRERGRRL